MLTLYLLSTKLVRIPHPVRALLSTKPITIKWTGLHHHIMDMEVISQFLHMLQDSCQGQFRAHPTSSRWDRSWRQWIVLKTVFWCEPISNNSTKLHVFPAKTKISLIFTLLVTMTGSASYSWSFKLISSLELFKWAFSMTKDPSFVRPLYINMFKHLLVNHWAHWSQISCGVSMWLWNQSLFERSRSHYRYAQN